MEEAKKSGVPISKIGRTGGDKLTVQGVISISIGDLERAYEGWFPSYMAGT
jgi:phosphoribosylformylglycinamidine synthase